MVLSSFLAAALTSSHNQHMLAFGMPGLPELMIVGLVVLLLFGNRLPSVMRSLGFGITEFKRGIKGEGPDDSPAITEKHRVDEHDHSLTSK